jgi:hypothetical protein
LRLRRIVGRMIALTLFAAMPIGAVTSAVFGPTPSTPALHAVVAIADAAHGHSHAEDEAGDPSLGHTHDHNPADHAHESAARLPSLDLAVSSYPGAGLPSRGPSAAPSPGFPLERPPRG